MEKRPWHGKRWPEDVPYDIKDYEIPLYQLLDESTEQFPDATYTIFEGARRSFIDVQRASNRIGAFLQSKGLKKGDRVAIFLPNIPQYPEIFFGILRAGCIAVTCNPMYRASELNFQLRDSGSKVVFVMDHPLFYQTALDAIKDTEIRDVIICNVKSYLPKLKGIIGSIVGKVPKAKQHEPGHLMFDNILKMAPDSPDPVNINPSEDPALILYTGGTTGQPKGAVLTHSNLVADVRAVQEWVRIKLTPDEKPDKIEKGGKHTYLGVLPWYHSFGLTLVMLTACANASRVVCIPDPRAGNPPFTGVLKAIEKYRVTIVVGVPTIYTAMANHPLVDRFDLSSIIGCGSGAAPLPVEIIKRFEEKTGAIIFEGYGLTETSPVITINPTDIEKRKVGTVGPPLPGTDIKILDIETGTKELPMGMDGEIAVSGPTVMKGYWKRPELNSEIFREIDGRRYFLTGDIGHLDEDGFLVITDRKKDMIIVGGFNVYPRDVEEVLYTHPKVAHAAVIGVPDEKSGERVKAFIQLKPGLKATEEEIIEFCKTRMAGYKRPKEVEFRDCLPMSVVGKILRRTLREEELKKRRGK